MSQICDTPPFSRDQYAQKAADQRSPCLRVDNIPALVRPLYLAVAWLIAGILYAYYAVCRNVTNLNRRAGKS